MSGPTTLAIASGVLVDAGLKATAVLALGAVGVRLARRGSAAQRHAIWASTFAVLPALLVAGVLRGPAIAIDTPWVATVWGLGTAVSLATLAAALRDLARLRRAAVPDPGDPRVLHTPALSGPLTWGTWRPVILLPAAAATWSATERAAALAHERAHVARHDWAVHVGVRVVCALFWFHPGVWWARRALVDAAEHAADDVVLASGTRPSDYAALLVRLARSARPTVALAAGPSAVGRRVRAVLDVRPRSARRGAVAVAALALGLATSVAVGTLPLWTAAPATLTCAPGPTP